MKTRFIVMLLVGFVMSSTASYARKNKPLFIGMVEQCPNGGVSGSLTYTHAIEKGGHIPVVIPRIKDSKTLAALVKKLDMVILTGGEDVEPLRYGAKPSPKLGGVNTKRDAFEYKVLAEAVKQKKPIFGTCRGLQMINVFFGGTLYQDLPSERPANFVHNPGTMEVSHGMKIESQSRLAQVMGTNDIQVNSSHHQAVLKLAPGFRVAAVATDGVVEAIECDSMPVAAVQFHPECLLTGDTPFIKIFQNLLKLTGK